MPDPKKPVETDPFYVEDSTGDGFVIQDKLTRKKKRKKRAEKAVSEQAADPVEIIGGN